MKFLVVACVALAPLASGCVEYAPPYAHVVVSANGPMQPQQSSGGYAPQTVPDIPAVPGQRVDAETIRRALDGNGTWQQDPTYGSVWIPYQETVGQGFVPYGTQGHWVLSDSGWYWQSELRFGWLTFHYGRWVMLRESWAWVPGAMFAPAWVDWRVGNGYVGWAPLPPLGATYAAPYAFCSYGSLWESNLWSRVVYGAGAASIYGVTQAVPPSYGIGGAVYAWGPTPVNSQGGPPPTLVPIASAWHGETNPRAGAPAGGAVGSSEGHPVGAVALAPHPGTNAPGLAPSVGAIATNTNDNSHDLRARVPGIPTPPLGGTPALTASGAHVPEAMAWTPAPAAGTLPHAPGVAPVIANAQPYETPSVTVNRDVIGTGRYRTSDTVVIGSSVPSTPIRDTVSLGTTESNYGGAPYAAPVAAGSYSEPHYAAPTYGAAGGGGYVAPTPSYAAPSYAAPSYNGGGGYEAPHYSAPAPAYAAPSYGGGGGYVAPHYSAPAPSYAAPSYGGGAGYAAPHYTAPAPSYAAPSYGGGGGYAAPHYTAPAPAYRPVTNGGGGFRR